MIKLALCRGGGTGRRARFRIVYRKVCRFDSCPRHKGAWLVFLTRFTGIVILKYMDGIKRVLILLFSTLTLLFWLSVIYGFFKSFGTSHSPDTSIKGLFITIVPALLSIGWHVRLWFGGMKGNNLNMTLVASFILLLSIPLFILYVLSNTPWQ